MLWPRHAGVCFSQSLLLNSCAYHRRIYSKSGTNPEYSHFVNFFAFQNQKTPRSEVQEIANTAYKKAHKEGGIEKIRSLNVESSLALAKQSAEREKRMRSFFGPAKKVSSKRSATSAPQHSAKRAQLKISAPETECKNSSSQPISSSSAQTKPKPAAKKNNAQEQDESESLHADDVAKKTKRQLKYESEILKQTVRNDNAFFALSLKSVRWSNRCGVTERVWGLALPFSLKSTSGVTLVPQFGTVAVAVISNRPTLRSTPSKAYSLNRPRASSSLVYREPV